MKVNIGKIYYKKTKATMENNINGNTGDSLRDNKSWKVLLVDDNTMMRKMTCLFLKKLGHKVLAAPGPEEAISLFKKERNSIDLLLTDVIMPGMNGNELKKRIEEIMPGIRTLFISGHTFGIITDRDMTGKRINFLQKPFSINNLAGKIMEVMVNDDNTDLQETTYCINN